MSPCGLLATTASLETRTNPSLESRGSAPRKPVMLVGCAKSSVTPRASLVLSVQSTKFRVSSQLQRKREVHRMPMSRLTRPNSRVSMACTQISNMRPLPLLSSSPGKRQLTRITSEDSPPPRHNTRPIEPTLARELHNNSNNHNSFSISQQSLFHPLLLCIISSRPRLCTTSGRRDLFRIEASRN